MNDRYLQYELNDFLTDDSFVNWVLQGNQDDKWQVWLEAHPTRSEVINEARNAVHSIKFRQSPIDPVIKKNLWQRIDVSTQAKEITIQDGRKRWLYGLMAAASIVLLAIILIQDNSIVYTTDVAMTEVITLPAQSEITLSSSSSISYKEKKWQTERNVALNGQGHFKVSKGVPFTVNTENGSVKVLGTEFDVVSIKDAFQVLVTEGKVSVTSGNHDRILTPGMAFYKNPNWEGAHRLNDNWKTNNMFFAYRDEHLSEVLKAIKFNYGITIDDRVIDTTLRYTGFFDSSDKLEVTLERIMWVLKINFDIKDERVVLRPQ